MASESTPLIQNVPVSGPKHRYPHQTLRRICTILLTGTCIAALGVAGFLLLGPDLNRSRSGPGKDHRVSSPSGAWPETEGISYAKLRHIIDSTPAESRVREWSKYYASGPHLAGKNLSQAQWTRDRWQEFGVKNSHIISYDTYINYPIDHRLALLEHEEDGSFKVKFEATLEEDILKEDRTSGLEDRIPTFHGYSANGNVTAPYVFVNYGTFQDFEDLQNANVQLEGNIAIAKYGHIFRGLKVKRAQELGMVGVVLYSDPGDDGETTEENGFEPYPKGPARQPSSVQRGSVEFLGVVAGDPTTPGYPSKPGVPRQDTNDSLPRIPSLPLSYAEALPLLKALNGHGPNVSQFNEYWQQGGLGYKGVNYNIGPSPPDLVLNLVNEQEYTITPLWDVIGIINGTIQDEVVILGNHRDAWIAGGAVDPNSGSATLNELARAFGKAIKEGWKPQRTIVLASWDGEEYGLIGSTEWVEEFIPWLSETAVAYLNVDSATAGTDFAVNAAPLLDSVIIENTYLVQSPNQTVEDQSVGDLWNEHIGTMGSGSDFTAFQDFAGIPSLDMGFRPTRSSPVYHYHSNYDSFDWMDRFGDPKWQYHVTMAQLWGAITADLVEKPIIPFNATNYSNAFKLYMQSVEKKIEDSGLAGLNITLDELSKAIHHVHDAAVTFDAKAASLAEELERLKDMPWYEKWWKKAGLYRNVRDINSKYKGIERLFLHKEGLDTREWYKHTIFAPGRWTGYAGAVWPGLVESIEDEDIGNFYRWQKIIADQMHDVEEFLS